MEKGSPRLCRIIWPVVVFLTTAAGCQQVCSPSMIPGLSASAFEEPTGKIKPKQAADVQIALARSLELHGEAERALAMYEEAVKKDPSRGDAWKRLGILHDQQGQFEKSAEMYQKALKAQPGSAEIFCDMGYSLYLQSRWSEAEMNLRQALALQPDHARAHNNLGLLLARTGKEREALDEFHKAGCEDADAHINLAFALTLEQHWPEARQHYQQALRIDPSSAPAKKGLKELELLIARLDLAAKTSQANSSGPISTPAQHGTMPTVPAPSTTLPNVASAANSLQTLVTPPDPAMTARR